MVGSTSLYPDPRICVWLCKDRINYAKQMRMKTYEHYTQAYKQSCESYILNNTN